VFACTISHDGIVLHIGTDAIFPRCTVCISPVDRLKHLMREMQRKVSTSLSAE
jgi:hypothetical protein